MLPYVVFLDIDKTLIGRSHALVARFWLRRAIQELAREGALPPRLAHASPAPTAPDAQVGPDLLRPGVGDALRAMQDAVLAPDGKSCVEFFICSLGTRPNVAECKVPGLERHTGVRFNRPLFCTSVDGAPDNCRSGAEADKKLVRSCLDRALAVLARRPRYARALAEPGAAAQVFQHRFLMIDDTPNIAVDPVVNRRALLVCPPYEHAP